MTDNGEFARAAMKYASGLRGAGVLPLATDKITGVFAAELYKIFKAQNECRGRALELAVKAAAPFTGDPKSLAKYIEIMADSFEAYLSKAPECSP